MSFQDAIKCFQCGGNSSAGGACGGSCSHYPHLNQQGRTSQFGASIGGIGYAPPNPQCINPAFLQTSYFWPAREAPISHVSSYPQPLLTYPQYGNSDSQAGWNTQGEKTDAWLEAIQPWALNTPFHNSQTSNTQLTNAILVSTTTTFPQDAHHQHHPPSPKPLGLALSTAPQYGQTLSPLDLPPPHSAMPSPNIIPNMSGALRGHNRRRSSVTSVSSFAVLPDPRDKDAALQTLSVVCSAVSQSQLSHSDAGDLDMSPHLRPLRAPRHGSPIPTLSREDNTFATSQSGDVNLCHDCFEWFRSFVDKYRRDIRIVLGTTSCENCMRNGKCDRNIASVPAIRIIPPPESVERSVERMKPIPRPTTATQDIPAKKPEYYCSVQDCNRRAGSGKPFHRNDNRNQHEWIVHKIPKPKRGHAGREERDRREQADMVPHNGLGSPVQRRGSKALADSNDNVPRKRRRRGARIGNDRV